MARLAFLGNPHAAAICLESLARAGHDIVLVVTAPDRRRGRGRAKTATAVKKAAMDLGLAVSERVEDVAGRNVELGVVVAFGTILGGEALAALTFVNVHFSLLPRWRGAAPVERAILAGDLRTGVSLMRVEAGLDTGALYASVSIPIGAHESASSLTCRLAHLGADLLVDRFGCLPQSLGQPSEQRGQATYAAKLVPDELRLDWSRPALELERVVRLGRAYTFWRGKRLVVTEALARDGSQDVDGGGSRPGLLVGTAVSTGGGLIDLVSVKPAGRRLVPAEEWIRGVRPEEGELLG
ncbi:MAG: methionyl-tRNA formyltransferase [Acidimicrobiales bacterium]